MLNDMQKEALTRMTMLNMSRQCINAFKSGKVWESEGPGSLYEVNDEEQKIIDDFESTHGGMVYHMIHNVFEFGECYTILFVSNNKKEWTRDKYDLEDGIAFVYVKNVDEEWCSEFGYASIRPSIGGLVRVS